MEYPAKGCGFPDIEAQCVFAKWVLRKMCVCKMGFEEMCVCKMGFEGGDVFVNQRETPLRLVFCFFVCFLFVFFRCLCQSERETPLRLVTKRSRTSKGHLLLFLLLFFRFLKQILTNFLLGSDHSQYGFFCLTSFIKKQTILTKISRISKGRPRLIFLHFSPSQQLCPKKKFL